MKVSVVSLSLLALVLGHSTSARPRPADFSPLGPTGKNGDNTVTAVEESAISVGDLREQAVEGQLDENLVDNITSTDFRTADFNGPINQLLQSEQGVLDLLQNYLPVELESALLRVDWGLTKEDLEDNRVVHRGFPRPNNASRRYLPNVAPLAKLEKLSTIQSQWGYLHYNQLTAAQRQAALPLVYQMRQLTPDQMVQTYLAIRKGLMTYPEAISGSTITSPGATLTIAKGLPTGRLADVQIMIADELLVTLLFSLAVDGEFETLEELAALPEWESLGSIPANDTRLLLALLDLEYRGDNSSSSDHLGSGDNWAIAIASKERFARNAAQSLGFNRAVAQLPTGSSSSFMGYTKEQDLLRFTANKYVHSYYPANDDSLLPVLAIRVHTPTFTKMLPEAAPQKSNTSTLWLDQDTVTEVLKSVNMVIPYWVNKHSVN
ncbi:hypothetical protein H4R33_002569 [Dimargaris cristalligena]|uniref:Uncharacterized protein n=1 Tax=Dimargaris cristalligena TaxID=215637 RepID=A0A4Q0A0Q6_9FUNG|nr:hypothetical protein H4R33_002569 [Dimargaris cristalligena]RKP39584.1 hypothetical protein BJ085DRAFT_40236 [Dimargaris cristalligena]|eukprot:RKP39584.1 hypothetical protein BJ085DRAFT_40236 [Dimargaris cristalligena]